MQDQGRGKQGRRSAASRDTTGDFSRVSKPRRNCLRGGETRDTSGYDRLRHARCFPCRPAVRPGFAPAHLRAPEHGWEKGGEMNRPWRLFRLPLVVFAVILPPLALGQARAATSVSYKFVPIAKAGDPVGNVKIK